MADEVVHVTAGVIVRNDTVLVCQRASGGRHPLKWEFPGGKAEAGETLETCMHRELFEELAIDAVVGRTLWRTQHQYAGRAPFALTFFLIERFAGDITNRIFAALRWAPITALGAIDFLDGDLEFVAALGAGKIPLR